MKNKLRTEQLLFFTLFFITQITVCQTTKQDTLKTVNTIGVFDGKKTTVGNFEAEEVYKINDYCIALKDITESQVDSLKGKKVLVTGTLKIFEGKTHDAKTSTNGNINEPYKEPDKKFITNPKFTIVYDSREPLIKSE